MSSNIRIGIVPVRRDIFNINEAMAQKNRLLGVLCEYDVEFIDVDDICTNGIACDPGDIPRIIKKFTNSEIDGLFFPHCDFGSEEVVGKVAAAFDLPVLIWGASDGEIKNDCIVRYTQCGLYAAGKVLRRFGRPFDYIVTCPPNSTSFDRGLKTFIATCAVVKAFSQLKIMQISTRPAPFWSVKCNEGELLEKFGIDVFPIPLSDLVSDVKRTISDGADRIQDTIEALNNKIGTEGIALDQLKKVIALKLVLEDYFNKYHLSAAAVQCWSAMQNELSIMPCATFGLLTEEFKPIACETDIKGAVTSVMLQEAAMRAETTFFSDVTIRHPDNINANLLWHCGNFPPSLAKPGSNLKLSNHPLQEPHPAAVGEWELRSGEITISRFDEDQSDYYLMIGKGKAVEGPKVNGTYVWMGVDNWPKWEHRLVTGPYIHHISGIYGDVTPVLYNCCKYIKGLKPDLLYPSEQEILNYLWDR